MPGSNVTIIGNLTRDPELRFTPRGKAVASLRVAVGSRTRDDQGNWVNAEASFFSVEVLDGVLAQNLCDSVEKGTRVVVVGKLKTRSWETAEGDTRSVVEIVADEVGPSLRWATVTLTRSERKGAA
jgi:single-strand DNA-binding protein